MKEFDKGLTAAKFAALHRINKSTLLYYDEIGLFSPAIKKPNGYRYYTYRQSSRLEMILTFRELGMSIDEIREYINEPSIEGLMEVLQEKILETDVAISRMKEIRKLMTDRKTQLEGLLHLDFSKIELVRCPEEYLLVSPYEEEGNPDGEALSAIEHARKFHTHRMFNHAFGTIMNRESFEKGEFDRYDSYFTKVENPSRALALRRQDKDRSGFFIKPAGTYMRAFCVGNWDKIPETYRRMLDYAGKHHLIFSGHAFEEGINEMAARSWDDYVTQITVRVENGEEGPKN